MSESGKVFVEALKSHARDSAYTAIHNDDPPKLMQWRAYVLALESVVSMLEAFAGMAEVEQPVSRVLDFRTSASESSPAF